MKIATWNVNGIRAILNKGFGGWLRAENPDIVCLQEIKASPDQVSAEQLQVVDGYQLYWNPAQRPGYSGVALFTRQESLEVQYGLGLSEFDQEGRVIRAKYPGFILYNIYFPNGKRDQGRLDFKLDFYRSLLEICDHLHSTGEQMIICGDFNTAHREIDLRNPKQNETSSGFLPEERAWIDQYLAHGFVDVYRNLYPDRVQYTWWTYRLNARQKNVGWRLDYFLVSGGLVNMVKDVVVQDDVLGSDHCPVTLKFGE